MFDVLFFLTGAGYLVCIRLLALGASSSSTLVLSLDFTWTVTVPRRTDHTTPQWSPRELEQESLGSREWGPENGIQKIDYPAVASTMTLGALPLAASHKRLSQGHKSTSSVPFQD